ncbi:hypothetical protein MF271_17215 (plasmid) [Deinococcus sp. KNUC1210]|uniref:hypothetical protein n=1 Tax=Deinococcus sp. KNUC1210 TaxID=2917691 RepID=UPI001EF0B99F|nr:hypothetical protein [Deinococcus sp. KNUC1210]ULH17063.1 hypothetical protein MF271_17215 [Deinococcus sp. KNUC1210]
MTESLLVTEGNIEHVRSLVADSDISNYVSIGQKIDIFRFGRNGCTVVFDGHRAGIFTGVDHAWGYLEEPERIRLDTGELVTLEGNVLDV